MQSDCIHHDIIHSIPITHTSSTANTSSSLSSPSIPYRSHTLLHVHIGSINLAYQPTEKKEEPTTVVEAAMNAVNYPTVLQRVVLPLSLTLHPSLLHPTAASNKHVQGLVHAVLQLIPAMINICSVKKLSRLKVPVAFLRASNNNFLVSFVFRETDPPYHMLTVSKDRLKADTAGSSTTESEGYTIQPATIRSSEHCHEFSCTSTSSSPSASRADIDAAAPYSSSLVSKHSLYVRVIPSWKLERELQILRHDSSAPVNKEHSASASTSASSHDDFKESSSKTKRKRSDSIDLTAFAHTSSAVSTAAAAALSSSSDGHSKKRRSTGASASEPVDVELEALSQEESPEVIEWLSQTS